MAGFDDNQQLRGPDFEPPTEVRENLKNSEAGLGTRATESSKEGDLLAPYQTETPQSTTPARGLKRIPLKIRQRIAAGAAGGILGIGGFFAIGAAPGISIVNIKEVGVQHFGAAVESVVGGRTDEIWIKKMNTSSKTPAINNLCAKGISVGCRYSGVSDKEISKLTERAKKAGVNLEIDASEEKNILGKRSVRTISINGQALDAKTFAAEIKKSNSPTRKAIQSMMKPRYAVWVGAKINNLMSKLGISKAKNVSAAGSVDEAKAKIKQNQQGTEINTQERLSISDEDSDEEKANKNRSNNNADTVEGQRSQNWGDRVRTNALKNLGSATQETITKMAGSVAKGVMITGAADTACTVVNTISAIGYMAKALGAIQLIRFAATISNTADAIKAGEATNESIQAIGEILTSVSQFDSRTFFDSYGWNWIAYGLLGDSTDTAEFRVGGGLPGDMTSFANKVKELAGGGEMCNFIQNPGVRVGSALIGIVAAVFSGGTITAGNVVGSATFAAGLSIVQQFSMPIIADMAAGEFVNETTIGNSAGNAYVSGLGALFGQNNNLTGLYPLTIDQAVMFDTGTKAAYLAEVKEESVRESGQLDATNPNSFLGSITTQLASVITSGSAADASGRLIALVKNPATKTVSASNEDPEAQYKVCTDDEYKQLNLAVDPFCNLVYGFSDSAMAEDADDVILYMHDNSYIDDNGNALGKYSEFLDKCIENTNPYGLASGASNEDTEGKIKPKECLPSAGTYDLKFWVYTVDSSIYEKMQCLIEEDSSACGAVSSATTAANGTCPAGSTTAIDIKQGYWDGAYQDAVFCAVNNTVDSSMSGIRDSKVFRDNNDVLQTNTTGKIVVLDRATEDLVNLVNKYVEDTGNKTFSSTFSYRSHNLQCVMYYYTHPSRGYPSECSGLPKIEADAIRAKMSGNYRMPSNNFYTSQHESGKAIDVVDLAWINKCANSNLDGDDSKYATSTCFNYASAAIPGDEHHVVWKGD